MKKVAVTGADGFIGTNLINALRRRKIRVVSFDRKIHDLNKISTLEKLVSNCDTVYHLAGITDSEDPNLFNVNVTGTLNLLQAIKLCSPQPNLVFASSFAVYKKSQKGTKINEKHICKPRNLYGLSKLLAEQAILNYPHTKFKSIVLRISNVYGPGMAPYKHSVVATFFDLISQNKVLTMHNAGVDTRDFIYVDDVVQALILAGEINISGIYNICSGKEISITSIAEKIAQIMNKKIVSNNTMSNNYEITYWQGDSSKFNRDTGWLGKTSIDEGLSKIWETKN